MSDYLGKFKVENMGTGMKRGMVLKIYKSKIKESAGLQAAQLCTKAKLTGQDDRPNLIIYTKNDVVRYQLTMHREHIKKAINTRLKCNFIQKIYFK